MRMTYAEWAEQQMATGEANVGVLARDYGCVVERMREQMAWRVRCPRTGAEEIVPLTTLARMSSDRERLWWLRAMGRDLCPLDANPSRPELYPPNRTWVG